MLTLLIFHETFFVGKQDVAHCQNYELPIWLAAAFDLPEFINILSSSGADINESDRNGQTPLHISVKFGNAASISRLLVYECLYFNTQDREGRSALHVAAEAGLSTIMRTLLARPGIDVNLRDNTGATALFRVIVKGSIPPIVLLLAEEEVDINSAGPEERTVLINTVQQRSYSIVCLLLDRKDLDVDVQDAGGLTALCWATCLGDVDMNEATYKYFNNLYPKRRLIWINISAASPRFSRLLGMVTFLVQLVSYSKATD
ncbi:hypothetical protein N7539_001308 [Penicillium diatomitis]|uniref:Uncharacterized protein n=1 Tax=Penicillium diatomitis TaxID=2819901 RepID=A0A9X0BZH8_9EURO|nr:uncharacterized protein N7539_001308 [Penicillium diatomitis]KAJ5492562.1 hypothetical protein N7539_001308 [Penicillium diatomitis]